MANQSITPPFKYLIRREQNPDAQLEQSMQRYVHVDPHGHLSFFALSTTGTEDVVGLSVRRPKCFDIPVEVVEVKPVGVNKSVVSSRLVVSYNCMGLPA